MVGPVFLILTLVVAGAAVLNRRRIRDYIEGSTLDDDMIRRIEQDGSVDLDDPIDMDEVRLEEERFWSETWDVPDEE